MLGEGKDKLAIGVDSLFGQTIILVFVQESDSIHIKKGIKHRIDKTSFTLYILHERQREKPLHHKIHFTLIGVQPDLGEYIHYNNRLNLLKGSEDTTFEPLLYKKPSGNHQYRTILLESKSQLSKLQPP